MKSIRVIRATKWIAAGTVAMIGFACTASAQGVVSSESVELLRKADAVRALQLLEDSKNIMRLPNGVYGFTVPWMIDTNPSGVVGGTGPDKMDLKRSPGGTLVMEVHKLQSGEIYIVGYLSKSDLARLQDTSDRSNKEVTIFFEPYKEYSVATAIPVWAIQVAKYRQIEDDHDVSDLSVNLAKPRKKWPKGGARLPGR